MEVTWDATDNSFVLYRALFSYCYWSAGYDVASPHQSPIRASSRNRQRKEAMVSDRYLIVIELGHRWVIAHTSEYIL